MGKIGIWTGLALALLVIPVFAGTFSGKVESIDADSKTVVVEGPKKAGSKTFKISEKATIMISGKKADLADVTEGSTVTVTFSDKDKETATRLVAKPAAVAAAKKEPSKSPASKSGDGADSTTSGASRTGLDWPSFDGSHRDNISRETGLLKEWPEGGPKLAWRVNGLGEGYSTVSVANGLVYTMGNVGQAEMVTAIKLDTGKIAWQKPIAQASRAGGFNGPRSTPTVDGEVIYVLGGNGDLASMNAKSGKVNWQGNILKEFSGDNINWGICESVLIDGDQLICTPGGRQGTIVAINKKSGKTIWKCDVPGAPQAGYASAIVADVGGVRQYIQFTSRNVVGVRAEDGAFLWSNDSSANGTANCSSPMYSEGMVFSATGYGKGGAMVELSSKGGKTEASLGYHTNKMESHHGGMVLMDGMVYGASDPGVLRCIELKTGDVKWQNRSVGKGSITAADGHLYVRSEQGPVALVELTPTEYIEKGRFDQPNRSGAASWPHPVISNGKLFLRDQDLLLVYDVKARN